MTEERYKVYGEADENTLAQMENCLAVEEGSRGVLCADNHLGYSQPIGAAIAYREHVSPSGVGYDIGCGNKAVLTDLMYEDIRKDVPHLMDEIIENISFGVGRNSPVPVDHSVLDEILRADFVPQRALYDLAARQLGTVGAGNHYVDLFRDEKERIWIGNHFGSRGFGHKTASGFLAIAEGKRFTGHAVEGEMMSAPKLFHINSAAGQDYISAMKLAGKYAYAGRDVVCDKVLEILGAAAIDEVHNHHNFAWEELHDGETWWVVRKGCTPAWDGQRGFVGSTMGEPSVILAGREEAREALFSTVHGAGRAMSRSEAAGKSRKRWTCNTRECDWKQLPGTHKPEACPDCGNTKMTKLWIREREGKIDWEAAQRDVAGAGVELRGGAADEAPGAYKRLSEVLKAHEGTVDILHTLYPIGVAMAPGGTRDPYKD